MFAFGPSGPTVPAAPFYPDEPATDPPYKKYTYISGVLYFRPPVVPDQAFAGGLPSPQGTSNSWVYVVNCRNEYSNALPFRVEPSRFQINSVSPNGFIGGQQVVIQGTGLEGRKPCSATTWCTPTQQVMFYFKLSKVNGTTGDVVERTLPAGDMVPPSIDERAVNVYVPSIEGLGYTRTSWSLLESKVYVLKGGVRSNDLPVRYCSSAEKAANPGPCWW